MIAFLLAVVVGVLPLHTGKAYRFKGMAIDPVKQRVFLASWDRKAIVAVDLPTGQLTTITAGKLNGMGVTRRDGRVYAVMNEVTEAPGAISALVVIDEATLRVVRRYELRARGSRHHFNHVVVDGRGRAYVSDTLRARIHAVDTRRAAAAFETLVAHPDLELVHGLALSPDGQRLAMTSYKAGIRFFDLDRKAFLPYRDPRTAGDDDLTYHQGALYGVGKNAVKRYVLAGDAITGTEVILRDHPLFDDPRILVSEGDALYLLANIEVNRVNDSHVLVLH
jgi:sugar lactone lactonase YvrE